MAPQLPLIASQDAMRETAERIRELEMALRESMNTSAHREALWAQEEAARVEAQRQVYLTLHTDGRPQTHMHISRHSHRRLLAFLRTFVRQHWLELSVCPSART